MILSARAESMVLSAPPAESMILSAPPTESMILSARAESMILSAGGESIILSAGGAKQHSTMLQQKCGDDGGGRGTVAAATDLMSVLQ
jgi:hypothetical protein